MIKKWMTLIFGAMMIFTCKTVSATTFNDNATVVGNKDWTIKFNQKVVLDETSKKGIIVVDSKGNKANVNLTLGEDGKTIVIKAPKDGYCKGESYKIVLDKNIHSQSGKTLKNQITMNFNIKRNIPDISNDDIIKIISDSHHIIYQTASCRNSSDIRTVLLDGIPFQYVNSSKYNNYDEIFKDYSNYFSKQEANNIISTNMFKCIDNKIYTINGDLGADIYFPSCEIVDRIQEGNKICVTLVGENDGSEYEENHYILVYEDGKWVIDHSDDQLFYVAP